MLSQLILFALPALAHHIDSVGKGANQLNSPKTHVNLGQAQLDFDNTLVDIGHHLPNLIPSEVATQQVATTRPENYGNAFVAIPHTQTRPFSNFGNDQLSELPLVNTRYQPYVYSVVPYYTQFGYNTAFHPVVASIPQAQNIASPQLNFEIEKLSNVGQKGKF
jgi:hypothetical protein